MPEGTKQLSELERAMEISPLSLIYSEVEDSTSESGFSTRAATLELVAGEVVTGIEYSSQLETTSKTITGAINELKASGGGSSVDETALEEMLEEVFGG